MRMYSWIKAEGQPGLADESELASVLLYPPAWPKNNKSLRWAHIIKIGLVIVLLYLRPPARWNQTYASTATSVGEARSTFPTSFPPSPTVLHRVPRTSHSQANRGGDICTCITGLVGSYLPPPWLAKSGCCKPGFGDVTSSTVSGEPGPRCFEDCVSLVPHLHVGNQTSILRLSRGRFQQPNTKSLHPVMWAWVDTANQSGPTCATPASSDPPTPNCRPPFTLFCQVQGESPDDSHHTPHLLEGVLSMHVTLARATACYPCKSYGRSTALYEITKYVCSVVNCCEKFEKQRLR
jgi:hypothetical protein